MPLKLQTLIPLTATLFLMGCGGGDSSSSSAQTTETTVSFSGVAVDGYISGATACVDTNVNGQCDSAEPTTKTLADGTFSFSGAKITTTSLLPVIISGGTDTATGKAFSGELKNIVDTASIQAGDSLTVSPLTDLSATIYLNSTIKDAQTLSTAKESVATAYGLTKEEVNSDPMKSPKVFAKAMELQQTKALIEATIPQSATLTQDEIKHAVTQVIAKQLEATNSVDTTKVMTGVETALNVTIADNKKTFVTAQIQALKPTLDELATKQSTDDTALNSFQTKIEKVQDEAVTNVINSSEGVDITVVPVTTTDSIKADNSSVTPKPDGGSVEPTVTVPHYTEHTYTPTVTSTPQPTIAYTKVSLQKKEVSINKKIISQWNKIC